MKNSWRDTNRERPTKKQAHTHTHTQGRTQKHSHLKDNNRDWREKHQKARHKNKTEIRVERQILIQAEKGSTSTRDQEDIQRAMKIKVKNKK